MLDFLMISTRSTKRGVIEIYPKFIIGRHTDLMIRGGDFYAIWIEEKGLWSTDEQDVIRLIDKELDDFAKANKDKFEDHVRVLHMWDADTGMIDNWHKYCQRQQRDHYHSLDESLIFANQETKKEDYASKKLGYPLEEGPIDNFEELISSLYSEDERYKIEWAIGSIVAGASKKIEKFLVLYGSPGTGKGTILKVVEMLFHGYTAVFDAKSLGSASSDFALEAFKTNPLVAIQYDGDLSHIENNARLNSLISHETMTVNEKHKSLYAAKFNSFLFMGTNKPVKITDSKSGIIRRLIDVSPKGVKIPKARYNDLMKGISFELGHIANYCRELYLNDPDAYDDYQPTLMMGESNDFYNFMLDSYIVFRNEDGVTLKAAWEMYKNYVEDAKVPYPLTMRVFKSELKTYFNNYEERVRKGEEWLRSYYSGFKVEQFEPHDQPKKKIEDKSLGTTWIDLKEQPSNLDILCADCPAQYGNEDEKPRTKWENVKTTLSDIDTKKLHYLRVPENHIVIDFDIRDEEGKKSPERNIEEASKWPRTYAEFSKSGGGLHLHYIYNGDVSQLSRIYADNIEIKVFTGNSSLRRKLTKCTNDTINVISSGLPLKGGSGKVINFEAIKNEKALRTIIKKNLNKEYHGATKPSMDFIFKVVEDYYNSGKHYDISDMYNVIVSFAASSSNQSDYCLKLIPKMHFKSDDISEGIANDDQPIVFYDVEVFPNLFLVNWKFEGVGKSVVRMINPTSTEIESLLKYRLVGFNCRRYDNHMLYARLIGKSNEELYKLSQSIINEKNGFFGEAYNISYTDIYDYSTKKQSLKKWEIELGIHHQELGLPWDQPVPEERWIEVAEYCDNDVISTEAVWNATKADFKAREILADIAGMTVNDTTNSLTTKIIFGNEKHPKLVYTHLEETFPGYEFVKEWNPVTQKYEKHNMYRGDDLGFGGYVYSEPGMYGRVALLDIASMHPHSVIAMNMFGEYTKNYEDLVDVRMHIKHKEYDIARNLFGGKLAKYLQNDDDASALSKALKIPINSVYGLTSASFDNPFRDPRNENNIVALRGALFMRTLQDEVVARGFKVVHIKTDSIKIPDATPEIIQFCLDFAKKYGYTFEHEATYDRICLVNDAVYIARYLETDENGKPKLGKWTATGTQFQIPYVFKKCFSGEDITFRDLCEAKEVKSEMYLNLNEGPLKPFEEQYYKIDGVKVPRKEEWGTLIDDYETTEDNLKFIGRVGLFCPIKAGKGGGILLRKNKDKNGNIKYDSVVGTKGYRWLESEEIIEKKLEDEIDITYHEGLVSAAIETICTYGDYQWFTSDELYIPHPLIDGHPDYNSEYCQIVNPFSPYYQLYCTKQEQLEMEKEKALQKELKRKEKDNIGQLIELAEKEYPKDE